MGIIQTGSKASAFVMGRKLCNPSGHHPNRANHTLDAQAGGRALFHADWTDVLFIHLDVDPHILQPRIPLPLDLLDGRAVVSLVAFVQQRLRPVFGGRLAEFLFAPLAHHEFLNVRTYVHHRGQTGIYFMAEWIPNRLAAFIGPRIYGLPYRLGRLSYEHRPRVGRFSGQVCAGGDRLEWSAEEIEGNTEYRTSPEGSPTAFLLERYTAFTMRHGVLRRFNVRHKPWKHATVKAQLGNRSLLTQTGQWAASARVFAAQASPGVQNVTIGMAEQVRVFSSL